MKIDLFFINKSMTDIVVQSKTFMKIKTIMEDEKRLENVVYNILQYQENKCQEIKSVLLDISNILPTIDTEAKKIVIDKLIAVYTIINNTMTVLINQQTTFPTFDNKFEDIKTSIRVLRFQTFQLIKKYSE